jgi:hypothetical protein
LLNNLQSRQKKDKYFLTFVLSLKIEFGKSTLSSDMTNNSNNQITLLTKISIVANILLFGVTGIYFLIQSRTLIGIIIVLAGLTNIYSMLVTFNRKNIVFLALNVLYSLVSIIVFLYYLLKGSNCLAILWLAISVYYVITVSILYWRIKEDKKPGQPTA